MYSKLNCPNQIYLELYQKCVKKPKFQQSNRFGTILKNALRKHKSNNQVDLEIYKTIYNFNIESILCDQSFCCCQTRAWQPPEPSLAAAKPEFGSCQTRVWQLPNFVRIAIQVISIFSAISSRYGFPGVSYVPGIYRSSPCTHI